MHVPFQVSVPIDVVTMVRDRLNELQAIHEKETAAIVKKIKTNPNNEVLISEHEKLVERGRKLTIGNLVRLLVVHGAEKIKGLKTTELQALVAEAGITRGRPRGS
jgi:hypothetical protein